MYRAVPALEAPRTPGNGVISSLLGLLGGKNLRVISEHKHICAPDKH